MIFYLSTQKDPYTIDPYLRDRGKHWQPRIKTINYEYMGRLTGLPVGTYVFTDLDRLGANQMHAAKHVYDFLSHERPDLQLLNNPHAFIGRFRLLRMLYEHGLNKFNVYRHYELDQDIRFPVFIRFERDHMGARSGLLNNRQEMHTAVNEALLSGAASDNLMIVEFQDSRKPDGMVRKYAVWRWGNYFAARHLVIGSEWMLKVPSTKKGDSWSKEWIAEEDRFLRSNPHLNQVRAVFEMANGDFGRIDYAVVDGQIQTWEINTNPRCFTPRDEQLPERIHFDDFVSKRFDEGWAAIDCPHPPHPPMPFKVELALFNSKVKR